MLPMLNIHLLSLVIFPERSKGLTKRPMPLKLGVDLLTRMIFLESLKIRHRKLTGRILNTRAEGILQRDHPWGITLLTAIMTSEIWLRALLLLLAPVHLPLPRFTIVESMITNKERNLQSLSIREGTEIAGSMSQTGIVDLASTPCEIVDTHQALSFILTVIPRWSQFNRRPQESDVLAQFLLQALMKMLVKPGKYQNISKTAERHFPHRWKQVLQIALLGH
jgi:hypothetical protein